LDVRYPEHRLVRTEVTFPLGWRGSDVRDRVISDPAFYFRFGVNCSGNRLALEYEYRSLTNSVPPERMPQYLRHLDEAAQTLGYSVLWEY
jgi:hypothetical protein